MSVFIAQFLLMWRTRRAPLLFGSVLLMLALFAYMWDRWSRVRGADTELHVLILGSMLLYVLAGVGAMWGLAIWRSESPRFRDYHASLPVHTGAHDLARVAAGAAWLLLAVALVCCLVAIALGVELGMDGDAGGGMPRGYWAMPFAVAFIPFLIATSVGIASDSPNEWLFSSLVVLTLLFVATVTAPSARMWLIEVFFMGRYGIGRALAGALGMGVTSRHGIGFMLENVEMWRGAAVFWLVIGFFAVVASALLHRRFRRS